MTDLQITPDAGNSALVSDALRDDPRPPGRGTAEPLPRPGSRSLSDDQIAEIRASGLSYRRLGERYGVAKSTIQDIKRNRTSAQKRAAARQMDQWRERMSLESRGEPAANSAPPYHVIDEANQAWAACRDITALLMGDPPPGRRALDRRPND